MKTAMLREAYDKGELVDRDPLLEIRNAFVELLDEGHREWLEGLRTKREAIKKDMEWLAKKHAEVHGEACKGADVNDCSLC